MTAKVHLDRAHLHHLLQQMKRIREFEARCAEMYQREKIRASCISTMARRRCRSA